MPRRLILLAVALVALAAAGPARAQRHNAGSSPPTPPPTAAHIAAAAQQPISPVSSGLGALQFVTVDYGVPAPQSLTRQLQSDDERTRAASLSAIGAPGQYLAHGHIPYPRSVQLDFVSLSTTDDLDAIVTAELDQHLVSAILVPEDGNWRRIATVVFPTSFNDPSTTPSTFLRTARSFVQRNHYRAIYRASTSAANGDYVENEAHLRIANNHAIITISFVSAARVCEAPSSGKNAHPGCEITHRWLQPDAADPNQRFLLVTASGRLSLREATDPLGRSRSFEVAHLRSFACQPFLFAEATQRYEPIGPSSPCTVPR